MSGFDSPMPHPVSVGGDRQVPIGAGLPLGGGAGVVETLQYVQFQGAAAGDHGPLGGVGRSTSASAVIPRGADHLLQVGAGGVETGFGSGGVSVL
ncbi:hypothetical protein [Catenulispora sp. GAS73]|uniref:hypothetical protein n=1 Tax=Catenulispora sp. GAS73 TaxID=3156269 RepID=UPI003515097E